MKARLLAACTAAVTLLSGCTFSTSIDGLLSPPKLSVEQEQIYEALRRAAGSNISLKYPKTGDYLSAFIVSDIDGDGEDEALVFYEKNLLQSEENALRLNVLDQINGSWRSVYDLAAGGAEVEKVMISRLGSNSRTNIIVGYSMVNRGERVLSVYDYRDGALTETLNSSYSLADVCDLDQNGENELLIVCGQTVSQSARAVTYVLARDGSYYESRTALNEGFTDFANLLYGNTADGIPCVWLDGMTEFFIGIAKDVFESEEYTLFIFLHELCHVLAWTPEGHDKRFEETLDTMLAQYNREHGTDLKNDYAGYRGDKSR